MSLFTKMDDRNTDFDDDKLLDDHEAMRLQQGYAKMHAPERSALAPAGVSQETHELVLQTMRGGEAWRANRAKERDSEIEALRESRVAEMMEERARARGHVVDVDAKLMVAKLRAADGATRVVVHVADPTNEACVRLDEAMVALSLRFFGAQQTDSRHVGKTSPPLLLRLKVGGGGDDGDDGDDDDASYFSADIVDHFALAIDRDALPALLIYRARELVASSFNVNLPTADDLEDHLDDHGTFG